MVIMKYICEKCNIKTNNKYNFNAHMASSKHLNNTGCINKFDQTYICKYCDTQYIKNIYLEKHQAICSKRINYELQLEEQIKSANMKVQYLEEQLLKKENDISNLNNKITKKENDYMELVKERLTRSDELVEKSGIIVNNSLNTVNTTVSALTYLNKSFPNAPVLKLQEYDALKDQDNKKFVEYLVCSYKQGTLAKSIGDIYISLYQKENPQEQSVWNSDTERLTFYIRLLVNDDLKWIIDKKGIDVGKLTIQPLLQTIRTQVNMYYNDNISVEKIFKGGSILTSYLIACDEITTSITNGSLEGDILRYISPYFDFKRNSLLQLDNKETNIVKKSKKIETK